MVLDPNKWSELSVYRWMMLCKKPLSNITHSSVITLKDLRLAKIKTTTKHGIANKDAKTRPLMTWVVNHAINKAVDDNMESVEILTNITFGKGRS